MTSTMNTQNIETAGTYKIVLIGDGGVGKSCFLQRHRSGEFNNKYIPTIGVEVYPIVFNTNYGNITFNCWDCAGQEKFGGLRNGYYIKAKAAIAFFDVTSRPTFKNIESWILEFKRIELKAPVVVCGNKCDYSDRKVMPTNIKKKFPDDFYYDISARTNYNFDKPFLKLARLLTGHDDLFFTEMPAISPVEINVGPFLSSPKLDDSSEELVDGSILNESIEELLDESNLDKSQAIRELFDLVDEINFVKKRAVKELINLAK